MPALRARLVGGSEVIVIDSQTKLAAFAVFIFIVGVIFGALVWS